MPFLDFVSVCDITLSIRAEAELEFRHGAPDQVTHLLNDDKINLQKILGDLYYRS